MPDGMLDALQGKSILVLGGSGVIGSRLVEVLVEVYGAKVSVVVRNLAKAVRIARYPVNLIHGDVSNQVLLDKAMKGKPIVIDCTFPKEGSFEERCESARLMARAVGEAALKQGVRRVVHLSTISVYGRPEGLILDEAAPRRPGKDAYGASKLAGEEEMLRLHRDRKLPVVVLQPTIVYGPFTGWSASPISQLKQGTFVLPEGGRGACNAVYLDDVVQAILRAAVVSGVEGEVYLISGDPVVTWRDFYGAYESMLGYTATTSMTEDEIREVQVRGAKASRPARRLLQTLREDAALRQMVLGLPGIAQCYRTLKAVTSEKKLDGLKDRLLDRKSPSTGVSSRPLIFPTAVQLGIYVPTTAVSIARAREALGYSPEFGLARGMELTEAWARWARLL